MKLSRVDRDQHLEYKEWLRDLLPDDLSQQAIADELGVTRKTISNLLSPNAGFGSGIVMLRYLQLAGAVAYRPAPEDSLLQRLLAEVAERPTRAELQEGLDTLREAIDRVASRDTRATAKRKTG